MDAVTGDFELGFDVVPGAFDLRPYLGLGLLVAVFEDNSGITPHGSLGTLAQYHFGIATLGAELRCEGAHQSALSLLASVGIAL
jgi:hypothetical protein